VTEGIAPFMFAYNVSESRQIARMQLLEDELLESQLLEYDFARIASFSNGSFSKMFCSKVIIIHRIMR
jgi:hypothetical protein